MLATASIHNKHVVKFGCLNENLQKQVIAEVKSSKDEIESIRKQAKLRILDREFIQSNQEAVSGKFSLSAYGTKVYQIYQSVLNSQSEKVRFASGEKMLNLFLRPERLNLLRT